MTLVALAGTWLLDHAGLVEAADQRLIRACISLSRPRAPDPRLLLLSMDETTARDDPTLLADRSDEVGTLLDQVLEAGAVAVGVDLLLPEQWSSSEPFANLIIEHSDSLVLALADRDGVFIGDSCLRGPATVVLGPQHAAAVFGITNVDVAEDGAVYRLRTFFRSEDGTTLPSFAARVAAIALREPLPADAGLRWAWIDYSTPPEVLSRMSWSSVGTVLSEEPERFAGRVVLLGQELTGAGDRYHSLPHPGGGQRPTSGLELQALMVNTLLHDRPIRDLGAQASVVTTAMVALLLSVPLVLVTRPRRALLAAALLDILGSLVTIALLLWKGLLLALPAHLLPQVIIVTMFILVSGRLRPCPEAVGQYRGDTVNQRKASPIGSD